VAVIGAGLLGAAVGAVMGRRHAWWGLLPAGTYLTAITAGGLLIAAQEPAAVRVRVPVALAAMHLSWGTGFLLSPEDLRG